MWLFTGILIGLGLAWYLFAKGYIPAVRIEQPVAGESSTRQQPEPAITDGMSSADAEQDKPHYDFFTVLPEMEVVVPGQNSDQKDGQATGQENVQETAPDNDTGSYLLQVGSFRQAGDAEQLKARLALIGIVARIQTVEVNEATWNRVRIGPVNGARQADELRKQLAKNGIDSLVMKNP
jgi:cell division protein FtsN